VAIRKKSASAGLKVWTVAELGAFYTEHRSELVAHASRILKDSARAEEVIQDALIKVMLAAPELESADHALGYMHRTIENLCIDIFRIEGRRPNLVVLDDATSEIESQWVDNKDHADVIAAADDAAIVRQALAMLSPAERAALVMWEMEGRSTEDIAAELGIKESAVRHTVSRARTSLRRVMSELIVDKDRGLTALDMLSTTYKKAADLAKKSSKAALSLVLIFFGFLGFNSFNNAAQLPVQTINEVQNVTELEPSAPVETEGSAAPSPSAEGSASPSASSSATPKDVSAVVNAKAPVLKFPGLDKAGVPTGFTVTDSSGALGSLYASSRDPIFSETELTVSQVVKTDVGAANILISEQIVSDSSGVSLNFALSYGKAGTWIPLNSKLAYYDMERLINGNYLITAIIRVQSEVELPVVVASTSNGRDLLEAPRQVITRLVLNPGKTQILAQAVQILEKGAK
jgi:RNA polymerase sigma factor (sigma-70 family)